VDSSANCCKSYLLLVLVFGCWGFQLHCVVLCEGDDTELQQQSTILPSTSSDYAAGSATTQDLPLTHCTDAASREFSDVYSKARVKWYPDVIRAFMMSSWRMPCTSHAVITDTVCLASVCVVVITVTELCLSVCLPVCLSVCLPVCLSVCLPACMSVCPSVCLPVCLSVCLYVTRYRPICTIDRSRCAI